MLQFQNNAAAVLQNALTDNSGDPGFSVITVVDDGSQFSFGGTYPQLATLAHGSRPGESEIVRLLSSSNAVFQCARGQEGTTPVDWPAGTKMEARVTAEMLKLFVQSENGFLGSPAQGSEVFSMLGFPAIKRNSTQMLSGSTAFHRGGNSPAAVGASPYVDLGVPSAFVAGNYLHGDVVVPTTPDGAQYWVCTNSDMAVNIAAEPLFAGPGGNVPIDEADPSLGYMVSLATPLDFSVRFSGVLLVVEEVGFISRAFTAGSVPSVSIGSDLDSSASNPTRFANNVALSQITGEKCIHRIPVNGGGQLVDTLMFKVETAATGGKFAGRFYWRGFFVEPG